MTEHRRDSFTAFLVAKGRKDGIVSLDSDYGLGTDDVIEACADLTAKQADACLRAAKKILRTDPRDAEIARLKDRANEALAACERKDREIARLKHTNEALEHVLRQYEKRHGVDGLIKGHIEAATIDQRHEIGMMLSDLAAHKRALAAGPAALRALRSDDYSPGYVAGVVEAAQAAAMKEGT